MTMTATKEKPIMFSEPMVKAILAGNKTMTRRVVKRDRKYSAYDYYPGDRWWMGPHPVSGFWGIDVPTGPTKEMIEIAKQSTGFVCPFPVGTRLWVQQESPHPKHGSKQERFWQMVDKTSCCWLWRGRLNRKGYGITGWNGKHKTVHRISWEWANGSVGSDVHVLHKCDVRNCVNPEHLYVGDNFRNIADKVARGRTTRITGEANAAAKLTKRDVLEIRRLRDGGVGQREIAEQFSINQSTVSRIILGKRWNEHLETTTTTCCQSRITLEVTAVKVERLNEISGPDCMAEGLPKRTRLGDGPPIEGDIWREEKQAYRELWERINGKGSWAANPFVWAISFKRV